MRHLAWSSAVLLWGCASLCTQCVADQPVYDARSLDILKSNCIRSLFSTPPDSHQDAAGALFFWTPGFIDGERLFNLQPSSGHEMIGVYLFRTHEEAVEAANWRSQHISTAIRRGEGKGFPWWRSIGPKTDLNTDRYITRAHGNLIIDANFRGRGVEGAEAACWKAIDAVVAELRRAGLGDAAKLPPRSVLYSRIWPKNIQTYGKYTENKWHVGVGIYNEGEKDCELRAYIIVDGNESFAGKDERKCMGREGSPRQNPSVADTIKVPANSAAVFHVDFSDCLSVGKHTLEIIATDASGAHVYVNHRPIVINVPKNAEQSEGHLTLKPIALQETVSEAVSPITVE